MVIFHSYVNVDQRVDTIPFLTMAICGYSILGETNHRRDVDRHVFYPISWDSHPADLLTCQAAGRALQILILLQQNPRCTKENRGFNRKNGPTVQPK